MTTGGAGQGPKDPTNAAEGSAGDDAPKSPSKIPSAPPSRGDQRSPLELFNPLSWPAPKGYSNGAVVRGPTLYIAGQIGWNAQQQITSDDFVAQFAQALDNVLAVVREAGGEPGDVAKMTVYVTDIETYRKNTRGVGAAWRERFGRHFPVMALVAVSALVEPRAQVEIETVAVLRDEAPRAAR